MMEIRFHALGVLWSEAGRCSHAAADGYWKSIGCGVLLSPFGNVVNDLVGNSEKEVSRVDLNDWPKTG